MQEDIRRAATALNNTVVVHDLYVSTGQVPLVTKGTRNLMQCIHVALKRYLSLPVSERPEACELLYPTSSKTIAKYAWPITSIDEKGIRLWLSTGGQILLSHHETGDLSLCSVEHLGLGHIESRETTLQLVEAALEAFCMTAISTSHHDMPDNGPIVATSTPERR